MVNDSTDVFRKVVTCLRGGDRKSSATNSRQSAGRHYQAIGANRERSDRRLGRSATRVNGPRYPGASLWTTLYVKTAFLNSILSGSKAAQQRTARVVPPLSF